MKKTLLATFVAATALFAMPMAAQTQTDASTGATKTEKKAECKGEHKACPNRKDGRRGQMVSPFEGITLTDAQKEAIKALRPERPARKQAGDSVKARPERRERPAANDTARVRPDRNKMRADYVNGVKAVLTPEQYVVFLENIVIKGAQIPGAEMRGQMHQAHGQKHPAHGQKPMNGKDKKHDKKKD